MLELLASLGVSPQWRKPLLYLLGVALLVGVATVTVKCHDSRVIKTHDLSSNLAAEKGAREADSKAADARLTDTAKIAKTAQETKDVIDQTPDGLAPDPAAVALACKRLQRAGKDTTAIPACTGRGGVDDGKAPAEGR